MEQQPGEKLEGWKEIALYLLKDVRTAARWAKERGLLVHRVPGGKRGSVFAYRAELDAWMSGQPADVAANHNVAARRRWPLIAAAVLLPGLVAGGVTWYRSSRPGPLARLKVGGNKLQAEDASGRVAWEHTFDQPAFEAIGGPVTRRRELFVDLDGDGEQEVVVALGLGAPVAAIQEVYAFTSSGKLLWRYRPQMTVGFGGRRWEGPWQVRALIAERRGSTNRIWAAVAHHTWWPSMVVRLDSTGRETVQFLHPGAIYALGYARNAAGAWILAGGVNNAHGAAALAVLGTDQAPASLPDSPGTPFTCDECPSGRPYRYYLFPPSEVSKAQDPYNHMVVVDAEHTPLKLSITEAFTGNARTSVESSGPRVTHSTTPFSV